MGKGFKDYVVSSFDFTNEGTKTQLYSAGGG